MIFTQKKVIFLTLIILAPVLSFSQTERWVYRYSGVSEWRDDRAKSIVYGSDGNIYTAGNSWRNETTDDFTVISLTTSGTERWIYTYNGFADRGDVAYSIVYGEDDNIYVAGSSIGSDTTSDFIVISLTSAGTERWVYRYNGPGNGPDYAHDVVYGAYGNIYAVGSCWGTNANTDFTVISLTDDGVERWVYHYNGPADYNDCGWAVACGVDNNIYAVGSSYGINDDFTVISLTDSGTERWVYRYNGPGNWADYANTVVNGPDSNVFVTGSSASYYGLDLTVISLSYSGSENWIYRHTSGFDDYGVEGVYGNDGNIYVAGYCGSDVPDFMVVSIADTGALRWEYVHYTPVIGFEAAASIVYGADGNVYSAGHIATDSTGADFTIISLTNSGNERWVYRYDRCGWFDYANSICYGNDGNVYAAGVTIDSITGADFTIISLTAGPGIHEDLETLAMECKFLQIHPNPARGNLRIRFNSPDEQKVTIKLYDVTGRLINEIFNGKTKIGTNEMPIMAANYAAGIYFISIEAGNFTAMKKIVKTR